MKLTINKLLAYSEKSKKYFYTEFNDGVNIIYGINTSGKSTVFQSILYTLGINDSNDYLKEILVEDVFFRIDCRLTERGSDEDIIFIREDQTMFIKREKLPALRFNGIASDNSREHIKLKEYMHKLFGFSLKLESKNEYKTAPIETMFLPYYVSQSVGWVYLRKSFSSLDFYKNFKEDYLDYYLGIESFIDRENRLKLENELKSIEEKIRFYSEWEKNNDEFQLTKLVDEQFIGKSREYIEEHEKNQKQLIENEEKHISNCNEISYYEGRQSLLRKISKNHKKQNPIEGVCPTCEQSLPFSITALYKYLQEENDTEKEIIKSKAKIKDLASKINTLEKNIDINKLNISKEYEILKKYFNYNINFDSWMKNKVNTQLITNIKYKLGELTSKKIAKEDELKAFKTEKEVLESRLAKSKYFSNVFFGFLHELGVKPLIEERYELLYRISAFPSQGVELHKTVLAYNYAFNKLIQKTEGIHRFPFMLDAIFKEDIDQTNKNTILEFIGKHKPNDTQLILSIAETKENERSIKEYNEKYFDTKAKLICIGKGTKKRAFLDLYDGSKDSYLEETSNIINGEDY